MTRIISIHALREEGDNHRPRPCVRHRYFYPRPPRGGRQGHAGFQRQRDHFYPRPPRGGRHGYRRGRPSRRRFLSTPSARRATKVAPHVFLAVHISIHALREEGDLCGHERCQLLMISIHALREEGDVKRVKNVRSHIRNFYPRPPRGGRHVWRIHDEHQQHISIHALREEGDAESFGHQRNGHRISIHALREEGDTRVYFIAQRPANFYPRPPRGGRQQKQRQNLYFQTNYTTFCTNLEEL